MSKFSTPPSWAEGGAVCAKTTGEFLRVLTGTDTVGNFVGIVYFAFAAAFGLAMAFRGYRWPTSGSDQEMVRPSSPEP
jgi:hypothetical protein